MSALRHCKKDFISNLEESLRFLADINMALTAGALDLQPEHICHLYESSFIKIFTAWEYFIENAFLLYMSGKYTKHYRPKKILKNIDEDTAYKVISGGTNKFPDWTNITTLIDISEIYFDNGEPFKDPLSRIQEKFNKMKRIRNAIVHISRRSREQFMVLVRSNLTKYGQDISPGEFLQKKEKNSGDIFIVHYNEILQYAAGRIIIT